MKQLTNLLFHVSKIHEKSERLKEEKRTRGEFFNVFTTLGLWSEEVRLHSAMISELLNPYGNHGMGPAFLEQFLLMLGEKTIFSKQTKSNIILWNDILVHKQKQKEEELISSLKMANTPSS